jgi:hypothetical protein
MAIEDHGKPEPYEASPPARHDEGAEQPLPTAEHLAEVQKRIAQSRKPMGPQPEEPPEEQAAAKRPPADVPPTPPPKPVDS